MKPNHLSNLAVSLFLIVVVVTPIFGCSSVSGGRKLGEVLQSQISRNMNPDISSENFDELVAGNNTFTFDLYKSLRNRSGNLFYSPFSISMALAMTYAGARGNTESQMGQTLNFSLPQEFLHPAFNALDLKLSKMPEYGSDQEQFFQMNIANSIWGQQDYDFLSEYIDLLALNYGAGLRQVDFSGESESARQTINRWVEDQTKGKIEDLIPPNAINSLTRLVLANAIYFKADWLHPFEKDNTRDMPFNLLNGDEVNLPMMSFSGSESLPYTSGDGFQAVELPYVGDTTSMVILVPDLDTYDIFEMELNYPQVESILAGLETRKVALTLPKFSFESGFGLAQNLSSMGMPEAFDPNKADFSGMDGTRQLFISEIIHKAFVAVDEKGTEAAAATAVIMEAMMAPMEYIELRIDRPFIFMIRDQSTGTILFIGRVLDPSA